MMHLTMIVKRYHHESLCIMINDCRTPKSMRIIIIITMMLHHHDE